MITLNISILGLNIKKIRIQKHITAYRLGKLSGISTGTISEIESGIRQSLSTKNIEKIAKALNVTPNDLFVTENDKEYIVTDIEQTINLVLQSDELTLDDSEMTCSEKNMLKDDITNALNKIKNLRANK
mgnify:CR=1 FL=1